MLESIKYAIRDLTHAIHALEFANKNRYGLSLLEPRDAKRLENLLRDAEKLHTRCKRFIEEEN